jgi:DNA-binding response OmpR family regulator
MAGKILLVEDDNDLRNMLDAFLEAHGYSIDAAEGVKAALELMESNDYDIVLIDKNMMGIDGNREGGLDLLRHVRSQSLPSEVIMMTGDPTVETAIEALRLGAFDYIPKPFSLEYLRLKISRLLKYRSFINSDYAIGVYRGVRGKMLGLIDNGSRMSHNELERTLLSLNDEIDKLFTILKESERIMLSERESLAHIAILAEQLKMNLPESDSNSNLVEEISRLSNKRL